MDPISTLSSCLQLAKEIYDLKQKMDTDDAACNMFFARVQSLNPPLEKLKMQSQQSLGSKKVSLDQLNECLCSMMTIANTRVTPKKSLFGFIKKAHESYTGSFKENLSDMNVQLDRCISALQLCVSVDGDEALSVQAQLNHESLSSKLDDIAAALQAQSLSSSVESQFQRDPYPEDFEDVQSVLGRGAFGVTHRMKNTADLGVYAVKVIRVKDAEEAGIKKAMMIREATLLRDLNHKYLVRYYTSYFSKEGKLFNLVMELVTGGSLGSKIKDQSVTVPMIRQWLVQLADVLSYLHNDMRLLHRDIKPDNILLTASGNIKLIDLGMACVYESSLSKMSKAGTQTYSSYEKAHGLSYDGRDDVWGAGCVFGELLTKSRLMERGGSLYEHGNAEVNRRRLSLIEDCMSIDTEMGSLLSHMLESDVSQRITSFVLRTSLSKDVSLVSDMGISTPSEVFANKTCILSLTGHSGAVKSIVCDVSRGRLYSGSWDKTIKVWDMSSHACVATLTGHSDYVCTLFYDASRGRLYSGSADCTVKVWNCVNHTCAATLVGHSSFVYTLVCDVSRGRLYTGSNDKSIKVWDMSSHLCVATLTGHSSWISSLVCDVGRGRLYSGSADKSVKVWDMSSFACVTTLIGHSGAVYALSSDENRDRLFSGSLDFTIKMWDMSTHGCMATFTGHSGFVCSLCFESGGRLYSGSADKTIKVWDISSLTCLATLTGHAHNVSSLECCDVNEGRLYSGSADMSIKVWNRVV